MVARLTGLAAKKVIKFKATQYAEKSVKLCGCGQASTEGVYDIIRRSPTCAPCRKADEDVLNLLNGVDVT
jgi:hypothetical protein